MGAKILIIDHNDSFTYNLVGLFEQEGTGDCQVDVWPVDQLHTVDQHLIWEYDCLVLSPGPGLPRDYPAVSSLLDSVLGKDKIKSLPVLGICLGLQTLVTYFGGTLYNLKQIQHGRQVALCLKTCPAVAEAGSKASGKADTGGPDIFKHLNTPVKVGLYHSWAVSIGPGTVPDVGGHQKEGKLNSNFWEKIQKQAPTGLEITAVACVAKSGFRFAESPSAIAAPVVMGIRHLSLPVIGLQFHPESYMTPEGAGIIRNWLEFIMEIQRRQTE